MKTIVLTFMLSISFLVGMASADTLTIAHSYYAEYAPQTDRSMIAPDSQDKAFVNVAGFYQGQFDLQSVVEHPDVDCNATSTYPAEFIIEQQGNRVIIRTPSGVQLHGRLFKKNRFRARAKLIDGRLIRKISVRGRLRNSTDARVANIEKVYIGRTLACKFKHKSKMTRISK